MQPTHRTAARDPNAQFSLFGSDNIQLSLMFPAEDNHGLPEATLNHNGVVKDGFLKRIFRNGRHYAQLKIARYQGHWYCATQVDLPTSGCFSPVVPASGEAHDSFDEACTAATLELVSRLVITCPHNNTDQRVARALRKLVEAGEYEETRC